MFGKGKNNCLIDCLTFASACQNETFKSKPRYCKRNLKFILEEFVTEILEKVVKKKQKTKNSCLGRVIPLLYTVILSEVKMHQSLLLISSV